MGYKIKEEFDEENGAIKIIIPSDTHAWLDHIQIFNDKEDGPVVLFLLRDRNDKSMSEEIRMGVGKKLQELSGLHDFFEGSALDDSIKKEIEDDLRDFGAQIDFKAGPRSKIRSVLEQAQLPADIKEAVLGELQQLWAKSPD